MTQHSKSNSPFHKLRAGIAGVLLLAVAGLLQPVAYGGSRAPELLGASKKSVSRLLGDSQPLASGLFNEELSESHSGGIGSTHAYRTRVGYLGDRSCYAFFMKKTRESFNPIEVIGLLYLCANRAGWREIEVGDEIAFIYQATDPKGTATGRTYLATLDETGSKLFVYSPEWRPDFNRELWITPDEAPVHREAEPELMIGKQSRGSNAKQAIGKQSRRPNAKQSVGKLPRRSNSKKAEFPEASLFGKSASARDPKRVSKDPKRVGIDPKQGIYLPKLNQVVPAGAGKNPKAAKQGKRKKRIPSGK